MKQDVSDSNRERATTPTATAELVAKTAVTGTGNQTVVLVPGGLTGWLSWEPHARALASDFKVVRTQLLNVDLGLRGEPLPSGYSIATELRALLKALDDLGIEEADMVGWSYGGQIALHLTLEHPERVRTLTLIEPPAWRLLRDDEELWRQAQDFEQMMARYGPDDVSEQQLADFLHGADIIPRHVDPRTHDRWPEWSRHRQSLRCGTVPSQWEGDADHLRHFAKPVLIFQGEGSSEYTRAAMQRLAGEFPRAQLVELPGAHVLPLVSMERFLEVLREFLTRPT